MDVQRQIEYWLNGSQDDMEAATVLLEKHKVRQSLFFAHLAVEKALKAHVSKATNSVPPRTHDLLRLADLAGIFNSGIALRFFGPVATVLHGRPVSRFAAGDTGVGRS